MGRCRHDIATPYVIERGEVRPLFDGINPSDFHDINAREYGGRLVAMWCWDCRQMLPLGPANDTPEVLVEVRAAELAQDEREAGASVVGWLADWTTDELYGWHAQPHDLTVPSDAECQAGWLAREIYTHEESDRG